MLLLAEDFSQVLCYVVESQPIILKRSLVLLREHNHVSSILFASFSVYVFIYLLRKYLPRYQINVVRANTASSYTIPRGQMGNRVRFGIDTQCDGHIVNDKSLFINMRRYTGYVKGVGGSQPIEGIGDVKFVVKDSQGILREMILRDVLYAPGVELNLLCERKLKRQEHVVCTRSTSMILRSGGTILRNCLTASGVIYMMSHIN